MTDQSASRDVLINFLSLVIEVNVNEARKEQPNPVKQPFLWEFEEINITKNMELTPLLYTTFKY